MKINRMCIFLAIFMMFTFSDAQEKSSKDVDVKGYKKSNGTYVAPHKRSPSNSTKKDNFSLKGNTNPYTKERGTNSLFGEKSKGSFFTSPGFVFLVIGFIVYRILKSPKNQSKPKPKSSNPSKKRKPTLSTEKQSSGKCPRCGGSGNIPRFSHINGGKCFLCNGTGRKVPNLPPTENKTKDDHEVEYGEEHYGLTDVFDRDELCDPDIQEAWDEENKRRKTT